MLLIDSNNVKAMDSLENIKVMVKNNIKTSFPGTPAIDLNFSPVGVSDNDEENSYNATPYTI